MNLGSLLRPRFFFPLLFLWAVSSHTHATERVLSEPIWASLKAHQTPQWFMDAKLGLFIYPPEPNPEQWAVAGERGAPPSDGIHVRYTIRDDALYAILFKWPQGNAVFPSLRAAEGTTVRMLDIDTDLAWNQTDAGLEIGLPPATHHSGIATEIPCDHAFVYKITPRPRWVE